MDKRKIIIDTDTASDDAVALVMALRDPSVEVVAITTVKGNLPIETCTRNALISIDFANTYAPPLYEGCDRALLAEVMTSEDTHGDDGMGNHNYPEPKGKKLDMHAVDALLNIIDEHEDKELELVTLGPLTNVALAVIKKPEVMKKLKKITLMGSSGLAGGNCTPVAEFNILADPEAMEVVFLSGIHCVVVGWDACIGEAMFTEEDIKEVLATGSPVAKFCIECNDTLIELNRERFGSGCIDFADPVAMAVALYPECVAASVEAYCTCETKSNLSFGQVIVNQRAETKNSTVAYELDGEKFKKYLTSLIV